MRPILCPTSTDSATDLPSARAPRNPPANASPAPFVSTIDSFASASTGYVSVLSDSDVATTVDEAPWVMTTTRGVAVFDLGDAASFLAISEMSLVCCDHSQFQVSRGEGGTEMRVFENLGLLTFQSWLVAYASASDSLPMRTST